MREHGDPRQIASNPTVSSWEPRCARRISDRWTRNIGARDIACCGEVDVHNEASNTCGNCQGVVSDECRNTEESRSTRSTHKLATALIWNFMQCSVTEENLMARLRHQHDFLDYGGCFTRQAFHVLCLIHGRQGLGLIRLRCRFQLWIPNSFRPRLLMRRLAHHGADVSCQVVG